MAFRRRYSSVSGRGGGTLGVGKPKISLSAGNQNIQQESVSQLPETLKNIQQPTTTVPELIGTQKHNQHQQSPPFQLLSGEDSYLAHFSALVSGLTNKQQQALKRKLVSTSYRDFMDVYEKNPQLACSMIKGYLTKTQYQALLLVLPTAPAPQGMLGISKEPDSRV